MERIPEKKFCHPCWYYQEEVLSALDQHLENGLHLVSPGHPFYACPRGAFRLSAS